MVWCCNRATTCLCCIDSGPKSNHNSHFHIDLHPPIKGWPDKLLADNAVLDQPSSAVSETLRAAAQGLLGEIAPQLTFDQGDLTMFVMDLPPDIPPQYAPIVVAEAVQAKQQTKERTIGACILIESRPDLPPANGVFSREFAWRYLQEQEQVILKDSDFYTAKVSLLEPPKHGSMKLDSEGDAVYVPFEPNYEGADQATVLVEIGGYKVKVIYFFKVMPNVPGSGDEGSPEEEKRFCPNGPLWRISFDANDPNAPIYTFEHPFALSRALAGPRTHKPISDLTRES